MIDLTLRIYIPGEDYPIFAFPPDTSFVCDGKIEGYYADPEADCQSFQMCVNFGEGDLTKYSLLCPNGRISHLQLESFVSRIVIFAGTLFNQQYFICDWWFNVDCSQAEGLYGINDEVAAEAAISGGGGGGGGDYSAPRGGGGGGAQRPQTGYGAPGK